MAALRGRSRADLRAGYRGQVRKGPQEDRHRPRHALDRGRTRLTAPPSARTSSAFALGRALPRWKEAGFGAPQCRRARPMPTTKQRPRPADAGARSERDWERSVVPLRAKDDRENSFVLDRVDSGRTREDAATKIGGSGEARIDLSPHHVDTKEEVLNRAPLRPRADEE